jgi:hypothetical protein
MRRDQKKRDPDRPRDQTGVHQPETTPAQERGERLDTGKVIARGGGEEGHVPGAEPPPKAVIPPAPPGEMPGREVRKTQAVADAFARLGERADPAAVAEEVRVRTGIDLSPEEVATIRAALVGPAGTPPRGDQPPPRNVKPG